MSPMVSLRFSGVSRANPKALDAAFLLTVGIFCLQLSFFAYNCVFGTFLGRPSLIQAGTGRSLKVILTTPYLP